MRVRNGHRIHGGLIGCAVVLACAGDTIAQDWPQFAGGPQRVSASGSGSVPRVGVVRWSVMQHLGQPVSFPNPGGAIVAGGVVYAVGRAVGGDAALAVDGATGAVRWAAPVAPPVVGSWSTPAVDVENGVVIVGAGSQLVGLRVLDGSVAWSASLQALIVNASPCLTTDRGPADRVLITDYAPFGVGRLYCINVDPFLAGVNPFSPGDIVWSISIGATSGNTAAYHAGRVYVACVEAEPEGPGAVLCFELADTAPAAPLWRRDNPAGQGYFGGVAVQVSGQQVRVLAASYAFSGGQFAGDLAVMDGATGALVWHAPCNRTDSTPVPLPDGRVIVSGGIDGFGCAPSLQMFSSGGELLWDTALATWNDLNGNQQLDPGEYLRLGGWTHQPVLIASPTAPRLVSGNLGSTVVGTVRTVSLHLDAVPTRPEFIEQSSDGPGASPAIAACQGTIGAFAAGPNGLFALGDAPCYANCDGSTASPALNVNDFVCFLNRFAAGESLANCDGSTAAPALNVNDFVCFLNRYAEGCG